MECGLQERSLDTGKRWLENTEHTWLLIMDNADDHKIDYTRYLPSGNRGNILMTTRNPECSTHCTVGQEFLAKLDVDDAVQLLLKASGIGKGPWDVQKRTSANEVVQLLGLHALAITQAGAFIRKGLCTLKEYPHHFQRQRQRLLRFCPDQSQSTYGGVYTTFEVSAQVLEKSSDPQAIDALELLRILAFVHFDRLPILVFHKAWTYAQKIRTNEENRSQENITTRSHWHVSRLSRLLRSLQIRSNKEKRSQEDITTLSHWHVSRLPRLMRSLHSGELDMISLRDAVQTLASFSIVSINETDDISMHPLVHVWARDRLNQSDQKIAWIATASVLALSTESHSSYQQFWRRLRSHVEICADLRSDGCFDEHHFEIAQTFYSFGWFLHTMKSNPRARDLLTITLDKLKNYHASTPKMMVQCLLAMCYKDIGQYQTATELLEKVVNMQRAIDPEHRNYLLFKHELARVYRKNGQHRRAMELLEEVVRIRKVTLDSEHPDRLSSEHALAMVYKEIGQHKRAVELLEEVVRIQKVTLDPEHPNRLASEHELVVVYTKIGQHKRAVELLEEVVRIQKVTLDPEHSDRLALEYELARAYIRNGQHKRAAELLEEVVRIQKVTLDPEHPDRLASEHVLAVVYIEITQYKRAVELLEEVVRIRKRTLDPEHPNRLASEHALAAVYSTIGQHKRTVELLEEVVRIQNITLHPEHPDRLASEDWLAYAYGCLEELTSEHDNLPKPKRLRTT